MRLDPLSATLDLVGADNRDEGFAEADVIVVVFSCEMIQSSLILSRCFDGFKGVDDRDLFTFFFEIASRAHSVIRVGVDKETALSFPAPRPDPTQITHQWYVNSIISGFVLISSFSNITSNAEPLLRKLLSARSATMHPSSRNTKTWQPSVLRTAATRNRTMTH